MENFIDNAVTSAVSTYNRSYNYCKFNYNHYRTTNTEYIFYLDSYSEYNNNKKINKNITVKVNKNSTYYDIKDVVLINLINIGRNVRNSIKSTNTVLTKESTILPENNLKIKKVIFNNPATIVLWEDGTKTVVKCDSQDDFDTEKGLAMAISKKALGNKGNYYNEFKKCIDEDDRGHKCL